MSIGVAIHESRAIVIDLETGRRLFKLGKRGATHVTSDGRIIVVARPGERARCFNSKGYPLGYIGGKDVTSLSLVDGRVAIGHGKDRWEVVDLSRHYKRSRNPMARLQALA